jgi:hypothetical protein
VIGSVPTHEETEQFWRDWTRLTPEQKTAFRKAVGKLVADLKNLPSGQFRGALRVKPMQGADGIWEMSWEGADGRATFEFGHERVEGEPHIIWRRIGGHAIFQTPDEPSSARAVSFREPKSGDRPQLPIVSGGRLRPGVYLDSMSDLLDTMERDLAD